MKRGFLFWLLVIAHALFWIIFLRHVPFFRQTLYFLDFDNYLKLWHDIFSGTNPYVVGHMITLGPPLVLLPFLPFVFLPPSLAQFLFFTLNVYCGYALCQKISFYFRLSPIVWLLLSLLLFATFPVRFSLLMGQPALLIGYLVASLLLEREKQLSLFSLIILKTFFVWLTLAYLRKKRVILRLIFTLIAAVFAFSPLLLPSWYSYYVRNTFKTTMLKNSHESGTDYYNQSLKSTLRRISLDRFYFPIFISLTLVLFWLTIERQSLSLAIVSAIYLSPVIWQHYLVFVFPVFTITFLTTKEVNQRILLLGGFLLSAVSFPSLHGLALSPLTGLLTSHMFLGLSILLFIEIRRPRTQLEGSLF